MAFLGTQGPGKEGRWGGLALLEQSVGRGGGGTGRRAGLEQAGAVLLSQLSGARPLCLSSVPAPNAAVSTGVPRRRGGCTGEAQARGASRTCLAGLLLLTAFPTGALPPEARFSFMAPPGLDKTCHTPGVGGEGCGASPSPRPGPWWGEERMCVSDYVCKCASVFMIVPRRSLSGTPVCVCIRR